MSDFWSDPSSTSILHVREERRLWRDCADALARLSHRWSPEPSLVAYVIGERGGSVVECRTPEREVRGSRPTATVLCPWARHFTPRKYWLITQEAMAPSRHDWKIVDWDVKPQHNQPTKSLCDKYHNLMSWLRCGYTVASDLSRECIYMLSDSRNVSPCLERHRPFEGGGHGIILILCVFVCFLLTFFVAFVSGGAFHVESWLAFLSLFFFLFRIVITSFWEVRAGLCDSRAFVCEFRTR